MTVQGSKVGWLRTVAVKVIPNLIKLCPPSRSRASIVYCTEGDDGPVSAAPILKFEKVGIAVVLARLRDRGLREKLATGLDEGDDSNAVSAIRDDIKDAIAAAMAALRDYEEGDNGEEW